MCGILQELIKFKKKLKAFKQKKNRMDEYQLIEMVEDDFEELLMAPPMLVRQHAFMEMEEETPQEILTECARITYHEEGCPICFCALTDQNTTKLMCGHVLCSEDFNVLIQMNSSKTFKCHICRAVQNLDFSLTCTSVK